MKLSTRDQMIVAGVLIGAIAIAFAFFMIVPQFRKLSELDQSMIQAEQQITEARALLASRQAAKGAAAQTQAELTQLDNTMPDAPELASLIIDLQDTANEAGVEWDKLVPGKPAEPADGYQRMKVDFKIAGRWDDVVDYLRRMSELRRGVRVLTVDVKPGVRTDVSTPATATADAPQELDVTVSIEVYSLPRAAAGAAAPAAPAPAAQ